MSISESIPKIEAEAYSLILDAYGNDKIIPPIDLERIVKKNDISINFVTFKDPNVDGAFKRSENKIYVNADASLPRQSFTIAHELGHFFLHQEKTQETFFRTDAQLLNNDEKDTEKANWFAAAILMPRKIILEYWSTFPDVETIANIFAVSYSAAYWRLKNIGLI